MSAVGRKQSRVPFAAMNIVTVLASERTAMNIATLQIFIVVLFIVLSIVM